MFILCLLAGLSCAAILFILLQSDVYYYFLWVILLSIWLIYCKLGVSWNCLFCYYLQSLFLSMFYADLKFCLPSSSSSSFVLSSMFAQIEGFYLLHLWSCRTSDLNYVCVLEYWTHNKTVTCCVWIVTLIVLSFLMFDVSENVQSTHPGPVVILVNDLGSGYVDVHCQTVCMISICASIILASFSDIVHSAVWWY